MILENKVVQKLKLEKNVLYKNSLLYWYFFFEKILLIFDIENWLWKYNFSTFWRTIIHHRIVLKQFPLSTSILGHKSCIFKIPQPNWHWLAKHDLWGLEADFWTLWYPSFSITSENLNTVCWRGNERWVHLNAANTLQIIWSHLKY